jgi:hypothetical protein
MNYPRSRSVPRFVPSLFQVCFAQAFSKSLIVPGLILLPSFAQAFSKGLILPIPFCLSFFQKLNLLEHFSKSLICSRQKTTPKLQVGKGAGHPTPSPLERSVPYLGTTLKAEPLAE